MDANNNDGAVIFDFARGLLYDVQPVPGILLKNYAAWFLTEKDLIVLLRIITPLLREGRISIGNIAKEFGISVEEVFVLVQPLLDNGMLRLEKNGKYYDGSGLMRLLYESWLYEQRRHTKNTVSEPVVSVNQKHMVAEKEMIRQLSHLYRRFERDLGRALSMTENEKIRSWLNDDKYLPVLVEEALKRAVLQNKASFAYIDSILSAWRKKGLITLEMVLELDSGKEKGRKTKAKSETTTETSAIDFDLIEEQLLRPE